MTDTAPADTYHPPRNEGLLFLIAAILGPGAMMLWLGKGRLAVLYLLAPVVTALLISGGLSTGLLPAVLFQGIELTTIFYAAGFAIALAGFTHATRFRQAPQARPWYSRWYLALVVLPVLFVAVMLFIRTFLFQPFTIPSASTVPSLMPGDSVYVSKWSYGYSQYSFPLHVICFSGRIAAGEPKRGDMAVFRLPSDPSIDYIKRVIGLPGDRVQMRGGILYINGEAAKREAVELPPDRAAGQDLTFYRETLPTGESHLIAEMRDDGQADDTEEYVVPAGHYFMMGDNRDNSQDSRFNAVGYVPAENFIGPVVGIFWTSSGVPISGR